MAENKTEIRVSNVSEKLHMEITNIAKNLNTTVTSFLKPKLQEIANSYPSEMKNRDRSKDRDN